MSSMVVRDEIGDQEYNKFGTFRRSLRQINPFKSRLFRLPATPRLTRARKGLSKAEEPTSWNFERPLYGSQMTNSAVTETSSAVYEQNPMCMTVPSDSPALLRSLPPRENGVGGSCRVRNNRHSRPPLPSYHPPNAQEAEEVIHEHMKNLMINSNHQRQLQFLPNTSYDHSGEVYDASWRDCKSHVEIPTASAQSTISCLPAGRPAMRSLSYGARDEPPTTRHRPQYHLNGLFHQPSMKSLVDQSAILKNKPSFLFEMHDFTPENTSDVVFLGREWLFKELHQTVIAEQAKITLIRGANGTGKTAIMRQLLLHSSFYAKKNSNGDTVDSGIVVGNQGSNDSTVSSKNYEWLRKVANKVVAYHECHLYSSNTCGIPEFIQNLASYLRANPAMKDYNDLIEENDDLLQLLEGENEALKLSPIKLFTKLIVEPLNLVDKLDSKPDTAMIVVDAIDEAEFHRNENGESISWLIRECHHLLPPWIRWILTASTENIPFAGAEARSLWIDDMELDERVARDMRLLVDYRLTTNPQLEKRICEQRPQSPNQVLCDFVDEIVQRAKGNALFIILLMDIIENDLIQMRNTTLSLLPQDLNQLYLLYFNCIFTSLQQFHAASTVMSVILASLRPLTFERLLKIMNSGNANYGLSPKELENRLYLLSPFVCKLSTGAYVQCHNSLREWLLHGSNHTDYLINVRYGHLLHGLYYTRKGDSTPEDLFELGHHLLKANPHKYMPPDMAPEMPTGRDAQVLWIQRCAGTKVQSALLYQRNVFYPNNKVTRLLLMAGAQTNIFWHENQEPLLCSYARSGNLILLQLLIHYGVEVNCCSRSTGMSPLMHAVRENHKEAVKLLLEAGVDICMRDSVGQTVMVHSALAGSVDMFALIYDCDWGENANKIKADQVQHSLELATKAGQIELVEFILNKTDVNVNLVNNMLIACSNGQLELVQYFLAKGVTLSKDQRYDGKSSLICAVESGSWDLVVSVLNGYDGEINKDLVDGTQWNALIVASRLGHIGLVDLLLNKGIDINHQDVEGLSALSHAILNEQFSLASQLINRKADINVVDKDGNTLLHLLAIHHNKSLVDRLLESGLQVDAKNNDGMRAVEIALTNGKQNAVDVFLRRGARLRSLTWKIAAESNPQHVISLIRKLFDDGRTLYRRNRFEEAMHRFHHALEKCTEFLIDENTFTPLIASSTTTKNKTNKNNTIEAIQPQLRLCKCELLYTVADIKRQNNEFPEAVKLAGEALRYADTENVAFQLHYFRAKCYFDQGKAHDARSEAQLAATLRPDNGDIQVLLSALNSPRV
ncbi:unnamed protein product [Bursaphelenchus xylophilus]|uniref:(pine wood nematode) hypothetical protein n=1 Tax=Bursaphelenchus xylophilus TaxID=6326 RepID=A0A1I7SQ03_BURXY|nr:unnamed protein product [Bursaphelenchus xylophilus]CAG9109436.1 unnamed protein product [Bursaphelenchus xylophilus]